VLTVALVVPCALASSCSGREHALEGDAERADGMPPADAAGYEHSQLDAPLHPDASCSVTIETPPLLPGQHVGFDAGIAWSSNPPSSGAHYPIWAAFRRHDAPVPRGYYVHDLEHGAVVLLYNCALLAGAAGTADAATADTAVDASDGGAGAACASVIAALQAASDAIADDPLCMSLDAGVRVRTVITPDPLIDVPVAAAAWGWTYKAMCADEPTLADFARSHYGQAPEVLCDDGTTNF
jgi:hypothetical protein